MKSMWILSDGYDTIVGASWSTLKRPGSQRDGAVLHPFPSTGRRSDNHGQTKALAKELHVVGLMNIQYAVKGGRVYVLEVNPRASRTVPFVSKATGVPLAKLATKVIMGKRLKDLGLTKEVRPAHVSVKESVFPFARFPGVDTILGPEMKSTGEVMGIDRTFGLAFAKSQLAAGQKLPLSGTVFISVKDEDKSPVLEAISLFAKMGFRIVAARGTSAFLSLKGITESARE
jgi:carbamoyl-phosphate synthase large subunit